jgi:hypothetical protein
MVCVHNGTTAKMNESFIHEWDSPAKRAPARRETGKFKKKNQTTMIKERQRVFQEERVSQV